jgi:hypothetical protein
LASPLLLVGNSDRVITRDASVREVETNQHKTMNNPMKALMAAFAVALLACATAQAVPITGQVTINGTATLNNQNLNQATAATSFSNAQTFAPLTGSYATVPLNTPVTFNPFSWSPSSAPVSPLWSFVTGGRTYQFNLLSLGVVSQSSTFLNITGIGTLTISGTGPTFDPTTGAWSFTISNAGGNPSNTFTFGFNSQNTALPEGGSALALLGMSLVCLELVRRKLAAA